MDEAIVADPTPEVQRAFQSCSSAFFGAAGFSCLINLLMFTGPLFMLQVYDRVLTSRSIPTLTVLLLLVAILYAFLGLLELIRSRIMVRIGRRIDQQLGGLLFDKVAGLGLKRGGRTHVRPLQDLDVVRQFLSGPGPHALFDIPWVPIYLAVNFALHFWLGVFTTAGALFLFALAYINEVSTRSVTATVARSNSSAHAFAEETRRNAEVVHAMGMISSMRSRWLSLRAKAVTDLDCASDRNGAIAACSKVARLLLQSAMLALGAFLAIGNEITPGAMIAASIIMSRALAPVEQSIAHWRSLLQFRQAHQRLHRVLDKASHPQHQMALPAPQGHLEVESALLMAPGRSKPILQAVNFKLEPGESVGIIGPSGAGKSTLVSALVGTWPVSAGTIRFDGAPLQQRRTAEIPTVIGYLPQSVELFAGTVEENINRFDPSANPDDVIRAANSAHVHEVILGLPKGYKTWLGEDGTVLSAGQRQRIGLARALYGEPQFVVLDEPNAHLDAEGEQALAIALHSLRLRGATVAIVAHRPSAIAAVDYLLLLNDGRQRAFGPRSDLLREPNAPSSAHTPSPLREHGRGSSQARCSQTGISSQSSIDLSATRGNERTALQVE